MEECQDSVTTKLVQVFGRRLCQNILAYFVLEKAKEEQVNTNTTTNQLTGNNETKLHLPEMSCALVERLVKRKKLHCNIADQEKDFLNSVMPLMKQASRNLISN